VNKKHYKIIFVIIIVTFIGLFLFSNKPQADSKKPVTTIDLNKLQLFIFPLTEKGSKEKTG